MLLRREETKGRRLCNVCREKVEKGEVVLAIYTDGRYFTKRNNCCMKCATRVFRILFEGFIPPEPAVHKELFNDHGDQTLLQEGTS